MIHKATEYASKAHEGGVRKGTKIPYITHPLETAIIVSLITDNEVLITAALLHDIIEDTDISGEDLTREFGPEVAALVLQETEDKTKTWLERKTAAVEHIKTASKEIKILTLADKLSNMRSTAREYLLMGDKVWEKFNEKEKSMHKWYYKSIIDGLHDLKEYPEYQELVKLYTLVFGE